jgi:hypothetical protein
LRHKIKKQERQQQTIQTSPKITTQKTTNIMTIITNLELLIVQQRYEQLPRHLLDVDDDEGIDRVAIQGMNNRELLRFLEEELDAASIDSSSTFDTEDSSLASGFDEDVKLFSLDDDSLRATRNRFSRRPSDESKSGVITSGGDDDDSLVLHKQRIHPRSVFIRRRNERPNPNQGPVGKNVDDEDYEDTLKPPARELWFRESGILPAAAAAAAAAAGLGARVTPPAAGCARE